jgi:hypothetical protein
MYTLSGTWLHSHSRNTESQPVKNMLQMRDRALSTPLPPSSRLTPRPTITCPSSTAVCSTCLGRWVLSGHSQSCIQTVLEALIPHGCVVKTCSCWVCNTIRIRAKFTFCTLWCVYRLLLRCLCPCTLPSSHLYHRFLETLGWGCTYVCFCFGRATGRVEKERKKRGGEERGRHKQTCGVWEGQHTV